MWRTRLDWALYPAMRALVFGLRLLPGGSAHAICDLLAWLACRLDRKRRRRGLRNVARALPDRTPAARAAIVRAVYRNLFRVGYEVTVMGRWLGKEGPFARITFEGLEHLDAWPAGGQGLVCVTAHVGNWEVLGASMAAVGRPVHSVAKNVDAGPIDRFLRRLREVHGQKIIGVRGAVREGRRLVQAGANLAFVADQHAAVNRIWVPFFGAPTALAKTPAGLARRFGVPMLIGFCRRTGPGSRFTATFAPLVFPDPSLSAREDVARMMRVYAGHLEAYVRAHPQDYLWLHRLWRRPVDGEECIRGDGTYVRHATFGSGGDPVDPARAPGEPGAPRPAGPGDGT